MTDEVRRGKVAEGDTTKSHIRCAIYTRKSSDEGLEQAFNSLDAQHEACTAYIASQRHEGWRPVATRFDDGGLSGGTMERPALQRLLAEIDAGRIGMVVVYKIDRLTRSLPDFARLVERLDAAGCSFVSVTQAFNTSTSMGRLTLNVLLSFAQFEREVTAERIRDKIAASKRKGLWMGGYLPLGYDRHPDPARQELAVNEAEAEIVRTLFRRYADLGNLGDLAREAEQRGLGPKRRTRPAVRGNGTGTFSRGQLHYLLTNPVYRGLIRHKGETHPGRHPAIIDEALWAEVQARMQAARTGTKRQSAGGPAAPLKGKLTDETGDRLTPTHTTRHGRKHRYYISHRLVAGKADPAGWRLPAAELEDAVARLVAAHLRSAAERHALSAMVEAGALGSLADRARTLADAIKADRAAAARLVAIGSLAPGRLDLELDAAALTSSLHLRPGDLAPSLTSLSAPLEVRRRGVEVRLIGPPSGTRRDPTLIAALARAHQWADAIRAGTSITNLARETGHAESWLRRTLRLAFLAPRIQDSILAGRQPVELTTRTLLASNLSLNWDEQVKHLGFGS